MVSRDKIVQFLNEFLEINKFTDKILNGLQVTGKEEVKKIIFGVTASLELFKKAADENADMIITHHGLISTFDDPSIYEIKKQRLKVLFDSNINHLAYHLPLDAHFDYGNNAQLMKKLGLEFSQMFARDPELGIVGEYKESKDIDNITEMINRILGTRSVILKHGPNNVKRVAIVSGGGGAHLLDAINVNADLFITGDAMEHMHTLSKEAKINVIFAGHYNSEKLGIMALAELLNEKFDIETRFIDVPNPL